MLFIILIVVLMTTFSTIATLTIPLNTFLALVGVTHFFVFLHLPREQGKLSEPSIQNNSTMRVVFGILIAVVMTTFYTTVTLTIPLLLALVGVLEIFFCSLKGNRISCLKLRFEVISQ